MAYKGLERNKLDYILTDILPVEISELFSFVEFYDFLLQKENRKQLDGVLERLKKGRAENKYLFTDSWASLPLKYNILKGTDTTRRMSVVNPLSALNLYLFLECYQKDIFRFFGKNHEFSVRYHKKNTDLFYKKRTGRTVEYFQKQSKSVGRGAIQQSGAYFKLTPLGSINSLTESKSWEQCNFKYKYYGKVDYKSCFDSIYTHVYTWIIKNNIIDRKNRDGSIFFGEIDRILQNINGRSSNGIVVGPEFSRMIAEVLLQQIDSEVKTTLACKHLYHMKDYRVFRYVDDIFMFAHEQETIEAVIATYKKVAEQYQLGLNELKLTKGCTPWVSKTWLGEARHIADQMSGFFKKIGRDEYDRLEPDKKFLVSSEYMPVERVKDETTALIKNNIEDKRTIVSFLLSALLKNIEKKREGYTLINPKANRKAYALLDLALFIYSFFPSFEQTRKVISIISYLDKEIHFKDGGGKQKEKLEDLFNRYPSAFLANLPDQCDWLPFLRSYHIHLDIEIEEQWLKKAIEADDPIIFADLLIYSGYNDAYKDRVLGAIEESIERQMKNFIPGKEPFNQREIWFIYVFHNCMQLSVRARRSLSDAIGKVKSMLAARGQSPSASDICGKLVIDFLERADRSGNPLPKSFFDWSDKSHFGDRITFRTYQRTIFRKYKKRNYYLYASID